MNLSIRYYIPIFTLLTFIFAPIAASQVGSTYTVKVGDTACGIAEKHNIPCSHLIKKNSLDSNAMIYPG